MSKIRTMPGSIALFAGPTPATGAHASGSLLQLFRLTSMDYGFDIPKEDVAIYGDYAPLSREQINPATVSLNFSYYIGDLQNEVALGFSVNSGVSALSKILDKSADEKNYFIFVTDEGVNAVGKSGVDGVAIGIGNAFVGSYSVEGSVGSLPTASVSVQGLNLVGYEDGLSENIPALDTNGDKIVGTTFSIPVVLSLPPERTTSVLKPRDITMDLTSAGGFLQNLSNVCIQSFSISYDLNRQAVECLGSKTAKSREPQFPINVEFKIEALTSDLVTGNLQDFQCLTGTYSAAINLRNNSCTGVGAIGAKYILSGLSLESQNWSTSAGNGNGETISLNWIGQISAGNNVTQGLFLSGQTGVYTVGL